jgi:hypothetical protein
MKRTFVKFLHNIIFYYYIVINILCKKGWLCVETAQTKRQALKVPKREIFDRSDFSDFYTMKSSWVGDLVVKILTYYFHF